MTKILFLCLGNICRSPMAEFIAKDLLKKQNNNDIHISSAGLHNYHEGENMHKGTQQILIKHKIEYKNFHSKPINKLIFNECDYIFVMDDQNLNEMILRFGNNKKIKKITDYCKLGYNEVPDPWYTHNFDLVYEILYDSITNLFNDLNNI